MAACLLALTIQLLEEALEIGHENVLAPQYFPLGEQLRKADVADHVIAVLAPILLGDAVEVEDFQYVGFRVSHINVSAPRRSCTPDGRGSAVSCIRTGSRADGP